jgi:glycerol-1-phosphate dehydrogenase [NAD(P)+]
VTTSAVSIDTLDRIRAAVAAAPVGAGLRQPLLREVIAGAGALAAVADALERIGVPAGVAVTVLSDPVPKPTGTGGDVLDAVLTRLGSRYRTRSVLLPTGPETVAVQADQGTVERAVTSVRRGWPAALVTVGSGTLADVGKVVAQRLDLSHVIVATAASVNGFADDQSVLLVNGAKRTVPSRWPDALLLDAGTLARAPAAMTRSGLGDLVSMSTAAADWYLAGAAGFDRSFSPVVVQILRSGSESVLASAAALGRGEPEAVMALAWSLTRGGLAMGIAGRTAPSSGAEHTISHLLEMRAHADRRPSASHGSQVGVASVLAGAVWQLLRDHLAAGGVKVEQLDERMQRQRVLAAFGGLDPGGVTAEECWASYRRKLAWLNGHLGELQRVCDGWADHEPVVADLLQDAGSTAATLHRAGAATRFVELQPAPDPDVARWAVRHCHLMRDRLSVVDLLELIGAWNENDIADLIARTQHPAWSDPPTPGEQ